MTTAGAMIRVAVRTRVVEPADAHAPDAEGPRCANPRCQPESRRPRRLVWGFPIGSFTVRCKCGAWNEVVVTQ